MEVGEMNMKKKYFAYIRKSSESDEAQTLSLDAQKSIITEFALREGINIARWFIEKRSAKRKGRAVFNEMMTKLENGGADGTICHKFDRLSRNWWDTAWVFDLMEKNG